MAVSFPTYPAPQAVVAPWAVVRTALVGALIGVAVAWTVVYPASWALGIDSIPAAMIANVIAAATVVAALLTSLRLRYSSSVHVRRALPRIAHLVVIAGLLAVPPTALVAGAAGYSWNPMVLLIEGGLVAAMISAAVVVGYVTTPSRLR